MALTQQELDYLKNKYGCSFNVITEKPIEHQAKFQLISPPPAELRDIEIIIRQKEDDIVVDVLGACGEMAGKYGVSYGVSMEKPISCLFKAISVGFDDVVNIYEESKKDV